MFIWQPKFCKYDNNNSNELIDIFDPSKGEVIGKVKFNINDFNNTITSSKKALSGDTVTLSKDQEHFQI